jgi:murein DD-endopeptidase MepM/ murein hydrolase activator NlpD
VRRWRALALLAAVAACAHRPGPAALTAGGGPFDLTGDFRQGGFARGRAPAGTVALRLDGSAVPMAADGGFLIAFGRDASPALALEAVGEDGTRVATSVAVAARAFPEERLPPINARFDADPDFAVRRAAELQRIAAARASSSGEAGWRQRFGWPATGRISGAFGSRRIIGDTAQDPHSGTDIAAPAGAAVVAPADGVVVLASPPEYSLEGNLVIVDHGLGLYSSFLHLDRVDVGTGDRLARGDTIGRVGATGRVTGAHLHWGVIWRGVRFDAEALLAPPPRPAKAKQ